MTLRRALGALMCIASCWSMWRTLEAVSEADALAGLVGFLVTWVIARAGVELTLAREDGALSDRRSRDD